MAEEIPHFNLNFDFLYAHENGKKKDISNENSQRVEKEKRFPDLTEGQRNQLLVDVEAKSTKSSTNWVVKVFKGTNVHE